MPVKTLPGHPSLDHLKYQARDLIKAHGAHSLAAAQRLREFNPRFRNATDAAIFAADLTLSAAQLTIARAYGFASWPRLKAAVEDRIKSHPDSAPLQDRIEDPVFRHAVELIDRGDEAGLRAHLRQHPNLVRQRVEFEGRNYFRNPALLEFIAENPIRRGTMAENIVDLAAVLLDAGAERAAMNETLGLVCSGCIARECAKQIPLIDLLCARGADADSATMPAIAHGEFAAVRALVAHGAAMTLCMAAALGQVDDCRRLLSRASSEDRHRALALASQFGRVQIARLLLDSGEDPNRYNPVGSHSHATPLHQAALFGSKELVELLVSRGARLDIKDILWNGTAADWAHHGGKSEVEAYLRSVETGQDKPV